MTRPFENIDLPLPPHLRSTLDEFEHMDVAVGYLNLHGWKVFAEAVDSKPKARLQKVDIASDTRWPHRPVLSRRPPV